MLFLKFKREIVLVIDDAEQIFSELCDMYEDVDPFPCAQYLGGLTFKMKKDSVKDVVRLGKSKTSINKANTAAVKALKQDQDSR